MYSMIFTPIKTNEKIEHKRSVQSHSNAIKASSETYQG